MIFKSFAAKQIERKGRAYDADLRKANAEIERLRSLINNAQTQQRPVAWVYAYTWTERVDLGRITELRVFEHGGFRATVDGVGGWGATQLAAIANAVANAKKHGQS